MSKNGQQLISYDASVAQTRSPRQRQQHWARRLFATAAVVVIAASVVFPVVVSAVDGEEFVVVDVDVCNGCFQFPVTKWREEYCLKYNCCPKDYFLCSAQEVDESCETSRTFQCKSGLFCENNKCTAPPKCVVDGNSCESSPCCPGLVCQSTSSSDDPVCVPDKLSAGACYNYVRQNCPCTPSVERNRCINTVINNLCDASSDLRSRIKRRYYLFCRNKKRRF